MPSQKKSEQALVWLRSQAADKDDILNGINAQICIEVIEEQRKQLKKLRSLLYGKAGQNARFSASGME